MNEETQHFEEIFKESQDPEGIKRREIKKTRVIIEEDKDLNYGE